MILGSVRSLPQLGNGIFHDRLCAVCPWLQSMEDTPLPPWHARVGDAIIDALFLIEPSYRFIVRPHRCFFFLTLYNPIGEKTVET